MRQLKITQTITNRDSVTLEKYFNEVSKVELLTPEEEVNLAQRIREGDEAALERLVKANLRFVISVAKQYHHSKVPLNDLINEGNIGLIKAAKKFDETKGFKFISYAVWWIRQSIMQALDDHSRLIRLPLNKIGSLSKLKEAVSVMEQKYEREPTHEELAEFLSITVDEIKNTTEAVSSQTSLDAPLIDGEESSMLDVLANKDEFKIDSEFVNKGSLRIEVERLLSTLTEKERDVIKQYFGIGYDSNFSLEDIGDNLGLTSERVRQIKDSAIKKLRSKAGVRLLQPFLC